jgi:hypothetical protein
VWEDVKAMFGNSQWLVVSLAMFIIQIRGGLQGNVKPYFIKYYIEHDLTGIFSVTENFMALYMGLTMLAGVAGVVVANRLFLEDAVVQGHGDEDRADRVARAECPAAPLRATPLVGGSLLLIMLGNFCHMMFLPLLFSAVPDTVDYGLKTVGRGAMALFFAGQLFALKMGISVGGGLGGRILGASSGTRPTWSRRKPRCWASNRLRRSAPRRGRPRRHPPAVLQTEEGLGTDAGKPVPSREAERRSSRFRKSDGSSAFVGAQETPP